jgi:hypothetical protein
MHNTMRLQLCKHLPNSFNSLTAGVRVSVIRLACASAAGVALVPKIFKLTDVISVLVSIIVEAVSHLSGVDPDMCSQVGVGHLNARVCSSAQHGTAQHSLPPSVQHSTAQHRQGGSIMLRWLCSRTRHSMPCLC